ncbi:MAG TPA: HAMP domain-containing sensor histidine kinase, partial [Myxococcales bacterium]|nr:HAMP domain-containing sensor histidine kinase [Myxococcales bacterium]
MPPTNAHAALVRWTSSSRSAAIAVIHGAEVESNPRFLALDHGEGWRWLNGPHARVRYATLSELVRTEAATLAPAPYLARFERTSQVIEVRLERLESGEAIALVHDVTGEVRRQRELQRDREALLHEERMHAMGVLASGVAHDLNHSLNIISLRVATLRADPALAAARRTLDVLARVVGDAARVVARLQDLARKRRDRPSDPLDLAAVLTGAVEMARTESDVAGVRIEADVPPLPLVRGSAAELAHVFGSLLVHAREQMPEGGIVKVRAREDRGRVVVTIRDYGEGLHEEDVTRLFDPFSGVAGETALGLSVAWGVMSRIGGSLQAQSRRGEGTTFLLTFPC